MNEILITKLEKTLRDLMAENKLLEERIISLDKRCKKLKDKQRDNNRAG